MISAAPLVWIPAAASSMSILLHQLLTFLCSGQMNTGIPAILHQLLVAIFFPVAGGGPDSGSFHIPRHNIASSFRVISEIFQGLLSTIFVPYTPTLEFTSCDSPVFRTDTSQMPKGPQEGHQCIQYHVLSSGAFSLLAGDYENFFSWFSYA